RAIGANVSIAPLLSATTRWFESLHDPALLELGHVVTAALNHAESWLREAQDADRSLLEAGARRFALTLGRATELALLVRHTQWSETIEHDKRATASARRFAQAGVDLITG
ncbi:MAG TPA: hypothetical protein VN844_09365, partial [Pyrinomonadaceae bacterium]|nr:hypothetical protein [Pyrinomonadaceae bacterium]